MNASIKSKIKSIDSALLGGAAHKIYKILFQKRPPTQEELFEILNKNLGYRIIIHYGKNRSCLLSELCDKYGSDKGEIKTVGHPYPWSSQTFADFYSRLFDQRRIDIRKVFECGLGTNNSNLLSSMGLDGRPGASLRVWREYFPNAQIVGGDIDRNILFEEERIKTFYVDQTDPKAIAELWDQVGLKDFDFMIDDGLHTYEAGICLFENSISRLSKDGVYCIEDVIMRDLLKFKEYFERYKAYQVEYVNLLRPNQALLDNNLVVIRVASET
jgi:hypothetical protein